MTSDSPKSNYTGSIDPGEISSLFRNHLGKIFCCVFLTVALTGLYLLRARPVYASTATLEVTPNSEGNPNAADTDAADTLKTIELKIGDQAVLLGVIKARNLARDPDFAPPRQVGVVTSPLARVTAVVAGWLQLPLLPKPVDPSAPARSYSEIELVDLLRRKLSVNLVRGSRLIAVTAEDHDPKKARDLAQAVIDEFFRQSWDSRSRDSSIARDLLLAEAKRVGADLRVSEEKLEAYREQNHAVSLEERQNIVVERLRDLNQQVAAAKNRRLAMEADQDEVRRLADSNPEMLLSIRSVAELPEIVDLRKEVALQEAQVATLAQRYGPLHPTLLQAKSELDDLRASLRGAVRKAGGIIAQSYASASATEAALNQALAEQQQAALALDRIAIPYHALERDVQANASMYQKVLDTLKQTDVTHGLMAAQEVEGAAISIASPPLIPHQPAWPAPRLFLAVAAAAGLFLGSGAALASRAFDTTLSSTEEAEAFLGLPVLATIPRSRHRRLDSRPAVVRYPTSAEAEGFRSLRTSLSLLNSEDLRQAVLFTSAVPGEGKSYCSLNYAAALAQQGLRTLLIDGDLRRPHIHRLFAMPSGLPGLTDCLRDPALFPKAVQPTRTEHLFRLGDWHGKSGGAELLGKVGLRDILERAWPEFDRIVIDTAPLMAVSDTLHLAKDAATICLVVHAARTSRRLVHRACKLLEEVAKRGPTGVVLNQIPRRLSPGRYTSYYRQEARA